MNKRISTSELKTNCAEFIRRVSQGQSFQITHRGKLVAELKPTESIEQTAAKSLIEQALKIRDKVKSPISDRELKEMINQGRD